jgi:hypothetical protein
MTFGFHRKWWTHLRDQPEKILFSKKMSDMHLRVWQTKSARRQRNFLQLKVAELTLKGKV